ncbi:MAG: TIGR02300 family protein [Pseudomonadota bacterium]
MPKEEWGVKRLCPTTGKRFYDMNRDPIVSPYTGETVTVDTGKGRTMVADAEDAQTKKLKAAQATEEEDLVLDDEEDEADVDVDLGDDVLDDDDESENVSLDELADVPADDSED